VLPSKLKKIGKNIRKADRPGEKFLFASSENSDALKLVAQAREQTLRAYFSLF